MSVTIDGAPRLIIEDPILFRLGYSFATRVQAETPSPPWSTVVVGISTDGLDKLLISWVWGKVAVAVPFNLDEVRADQERFFTHIGPILDQIQVKYRESLPGFAREGNLMDENPLS